MKITQKELCAYINQYPWRTPSQLAAHFAVTTMTIHRHLKKLITTWDITKRGKTPHVQYYPTNDPTPAYTAITPAQKRLLQHERYQISKTGQELIGAEWFVSWCQIRNIDPTDAAIRRSDHIDYIDSITTPMGIDATHKLHDYGIHHLDQLLYGHIYALPEFGKTKHGTRMELAKTYPSTDLFGKLCDAIKDQLSTIASEKNIDAVCFARPTARRSLQIMDYTSKTLLTHLPRIPLQKTPGYFPAQKTLKKREDRIANAQASFELLTTSTQYNHALIIDDAVWSGATIAEIGNKIITAWLAKQVTGFSMIGTANGIFDQVKKFEVIAQV